MSRMNLSRYVGNVTIAYLVECSLLRAV